MKILLGLLILVVSQLSFAADPVCTVSSGKITDTSDCRSEADEYTLYLYDIGLCTSEPTPGNLSSCSFWGVEPGYFTMTPQSTTDLSISNEVKNGTYRWFVTVQSQQIGLKASKRFSSSLNGNTASGEFCWTRGYTYNLLGWDTSNRSEWTAECGSAFPSSIPKNTINYDSLTRHSFLASGTKTLPSGKTGKMYLTKADASFSSAISASEVERLLWVSQLDAPITISDKRKTFSMTIDRSMGTLVNIDSSVNLSGLLPNTFEITFAQSQ